MGATVAAEDEYDTSPAAIQRFTALFTQELPLYASLIERVLPAPDVENELEVVMKPAAGERGDQEFESQVRLAPSSQLNTARIQRVRGHPLPPPPTHII